MNMTHARCLLLASALLSSGCTTLMKPDPDQQAAEQRWLAHRDDVSRISQFTLKGRASDGGVLGIKADLYWQQNADGSYKLRLSGPFGIGTVLIEGDDNLVNVKTRSETYESNDPEAWIREKVGISLPLRGLRRWILGLPSPDSPAHLELGLDGLVEHLAQNEWKIDYLEYTESDGYQLPKKLEATDGTVKIKILADTWSDLP